MRRDPGSRRIPRAVGAGLIAVAAVAVIVVAAVLLVRMQQDRRVAADQAASYTPPPPDVGGLPLVTVIGDSFVSGSAADADATSLWTARLGRALGVTVQNLGVGGSGYVMRSRTATDRSTFETRASGVDPDSAEVVFFGSRNDGSASAAKIYAAAMRSFQAVHDVAPRTKLIVIGPTWKNTHPPSGIGRARDAVHRAAVAAHATWVDPIARRWLPSDAGLLDASGVYQDAKGQAGIAALVEPIVRAQLP